MEFRLLGPVEVWRDDSQLHVGGPRERKILAVLVLNARQTVSVDRLITASWDQSPPRTARDQVRNIVGILRRRLARHDSAAPSAIVSTSNGFVLTVDAEHIDARQFDIHFENAAKAAQNGEIAHAAETLRSALALWRGPALGGLDGHYLRAEAHRLEERRQVCLERRIECDLALGRHHELIGELAALVAEFHNRERLLELYMLALHRSGRRQDALNAYSSARATLAEELGLDPSPSTQALQQAILRGEQPELTDAYYGLTWAPPEHDSRETRLAVPSRRTSERLPSLTLIDSSGYIPPLSQLPADPADFTGREEELAQITHLLRPEPGSPVPIVTICGQAGVGKTTIAVRAAHEISSTYPDGQLYVKLRGPDAGDDPGSVLGRLLRALGISGASIPRGVQERAALFRSRVAGRRMLLLLDDAADERQIRPLPPGSPGCGVIVTSRARLAGLEGARPVDVRVFEPDHAVELLARITGPDRLAGEAAAARELVRLCGYLPLAIRVAAARLAARPSWDVKRMIGLLTNERDRLDALTAGDLAVRATLASAYRGLDASTRRIFRLLGMLRAADYPAWAAAALCDCDVSEAEMRVQALVDVHLLDEVCVDATGEIRYRMHDLTRLFAGERAFAEESAQARKTALSRVIGAWHALAEAADRRMPARFLTPIAGPGRRWELPPSRKEALLSDPVAWFAAEHKSLVAITDQACDEGLTASAWDLAARCVTHFQLRGHFDDWAAVHQQVLKTCVRSGDSLGEAVTLRGLAYLHTIGPDSYEAGHACASRALALFTSIGRPAGVADVQLLRAELYRLKGDLDSATSCVQTAVAIAKREGCQTSELVAWQLSGLISRVRGEYDQAAVHLARALDLAKHLQLTFHEAETHRLLGIVNRERGDLAPALDSLQQAQRIFEQLDDTSGQAFTLLAMGDLYVRQGDPRARSTLERAYTQFDNLHIVFGLADVQRVIGQLCTTEGRHSEAIDHLIEALALYRTLGSLFAEALTLKALGQAQRASGDRASAASAWREACDIFNRLHNDEEANQLRKHLADL